MEKMENKERFPLSPRHDYGYLLDLFMKSVALVI